MLIIAKNLGKKFFQANAETQVLHDINFVFSSGSSYALTGVSGSGKSTLLHILSGLDSPTSGAVLFENAEVRPRFGVVFQEDYLIEHLSVFDNVAIAGVAQQLPAAEIREKVTGLLEKTQLQDKQHCYPSELSGGQRTRVAICRALLTGPDFLFADEPTGNLDEENAARIVDLILGLQEDFKMGVVVCTHDQKVFSRMQHVLRLSGGTLQAV